MPAKGMEEPSTIASGFMASAISRRPSSKSIVSVLNPWKPSSSWISFTTLGTSSMMSRVECGRPEPFTTTSVIDMRFNEAYEKAFKLETMSDAAAYQLRLTPQRAWALIMRRLGYIRDR